MGFFRKLLRKLKPIVVPLAKDAARNYVARKVHLDADIVDELVRRRGGDRRRDDN